MWPHAPEAQLHQPPRLRNSPPGGLGSQQPSAMCMPPSVSGGWGLGKDPPPPCSWPAPLTPPPPGRVPPASAHEPRELPLCPGLPSFVAALLGRGHQAKAPALLGEALTVSRGLAFHPSGSIRRPVPAAPGTPAHPRGRDLVRGGVLAPQARLAALSKAHRSSCVNNIYSRRSQDPIVQ